MEPTKIRNVKPKPICVGCGGVPRGKKLTCVACSIEDRKRYSSALAGITWPVRHKSF